MEISSVTWWSTIQMHSCGLCIYTIIISKTEISVSDLIGSKFLFLWCTPNNLSTVTFSSCILGIVPFRKNKRPHTWNVCLLLCATHSFQDVPKASLVDNSLFTNPHPKHSPLPLVSGREYFLILFSSTNVMKISEDPLLRNSINAEESAHCLQSAI